MKMTNYHFNMTKLSENDIEQWAIEELQAVGWSYVNGAEMAPDGTHPERTSFSSVILEERLKAAIARINLILPLEAQTEALKVVLRLNDQNIIVNNRLFHQYLTEGVPVEYRKDGTMRGDRVQLVDFNQLENNDWLVVNQFTIIENNQNKRPDLLLFVNGIPLVLIELKNAADENATIESAYKQIQTYKESIPSLFHFNEICIISDGVDAKAGSLSAGLTRYLTWKIKDDDNRSMFTNQLEIMLTELLKPSVLLDFVRHFIVYEENRSTDVNGLVHITTVKKIAAYHQYYAVNKAIESVKEAAGEHGDRKGGVVWHTQGSGKSLSMVFFTGKLVVSLNNPTILMITDRNDLDDQLFDTFAASKDLLRQVPVQANDREHLKELLKVASGGIVFTTIQKFQPEEGNVYETLSERTNIIVIADEAHRTQYGFKPKSADVKDDQGNVVGQKLVYGFAKYMRDALPNATYLGFTGTPVEKTDANTPAVFGKYVDIYDIGQAVTDGATVPIYYESRLAKINLSDEGKALIEDLDQELESDELTDTQRAKAKWAKVEAIIGSEQRIKTIATDIVQHFEARNGAGGLTGKGMIVTMSRRIAVDLYNEIIKIRPHWHSNDLAKGAIKVVMTAASSDGPELMKHHTSKQQRRDLADRMKDVSDPLQLVIVRDMWLTGFDAPSMHTLYIDKPMKGHNLMQAIARVNRVYKDKPGGLVVDYFGIAHDLKQALNFYSESGGKGDPAEAQEKAVALMLEKLEVVSAMFSEKAIYQSDIVNLAAEDRALYGKTFQYERYFSAGTKEKLDLILSGVEHVLSLEDGKNRFLREITALSQAFAIALPHDQAMDARDEIAYFQAIKARIVKFDAQGGGGKSDAELETAIKQIIDQALVSEKVIDIFDAAGIKKPEISVLDEEFLEEMKGMKHKNLALEVLKKLLNDEIKIRSKHNLIQSRSLMEMLENSIKRYQNNLITSAEIIQEFINLAKEIKESDKRGEKLGLSKDELAFYDAVAANESAKQLLGDEILIKLARELVIKVKENATIDWTVKESVKQGMKVAVKRLLRVYGYPPDLQKLAADTVLSQAEMLAEFWS
jgi:type I restriction enzyme R subunit